MTLEDPYFTVKEEVCRALTKVRGLIARWDELSDQLAAELTGKATPSSSLPPTPIGPGLPLLLHLDIREDLNWTLNEIRNALRSLDWDLEDLEDTICIIEKNPSKFRIDEEDLLCRRNFIQECTEEVRLMKEKMKINVNKDRDLDITATQLMSDSPLKLLPATHGTAKYSKLLNQNDSPLRLLVHHQGPICNQNAMLRQHDELLDSISTTVGPLKTVSRKIHSEFDERQIMLDELDNEMEIITDSKLDSTMKKVGRIFGRSNGNYNNYTPAPTTSTSNADTDNYIPRPCSLSSLTSTITNCFVCSKD